MFSTKIYGSWHETQHEKYVQIFHQLGGLFTGKILDIGSGHGYLQRFVKERAKADITALDIEMPAQIIADGGRLPFKDNSFDAVISIDAMHLIKGNDFARVLKTNGFALLALFFNNENYEERKALLKQRLQGFQILKEFELHGKENEYVVIGRK